MPDKVAMREKEFGIWQSFTWRDYHDHVRDFALGLVALGLQPGENVAIIGENRPEWVWSEIAAQACGAASVGLYQDSNLTDVAYVIDHCDASVVVAEDQEQVDKILDLLEKLPKVRWVVFTDPRGLRKYHHEKLIAFTDVEAKGRELAAAQPALWAANVARGKAADLAIISYTSGTTGFPKGAMLSFRNLLGMAMNLHAVDEKRPTDEFVSFLPLAWIGEQMMSLSSALAIGFTVNFPEEPETTAGEHPRDRPSRDVRAAALLGVDDLHRAGEDHGHLALQAVHVQPLHAHRAQGGRPALREEAGAAPPQGALPARLLGALPRPARPARLHLHPQRLDRRRRARPRRLRLLPRHGRAPQADLRPDRDLRHQLHPPRRATSSRTPWACPSPAPRSASPRPARSSRAAPSVFLGYYKNEEATAKTVVDGWLHSGDAGYLAPDGQLVVIDRLKDVMKLADGTQFSPQFIENRLKFSPYVKEAVVIGHDRPFLTAMLCIDMGVVGKWAEKSRLSYTTYTDLSAKPQVYDLLQREVDLVNEKLPEAARIAKFVLLYKELDADDEELTRTRKVRRGFVEERYREVIAGALRRRARGGHRHHHQVPGRQDHPHPHHAAGAQAQDGQGGLMEFFLQLLVSGLVIGSIYALVGLGFVIIYKSSSILNFAQGEFLMLGAYVCVAIVGTHKVPFLAAFLLTLGFSALLGVLMERLLLRPMIGEPVISVIMLTLGLSSVLKALVQGIWGTDTRPYPEIFPTTPVMLGPLPVSQGYLYSVASVLVLLTLFSVFFKYSRAGIAMRATAFSQQVALSMGISVKRIFALAWSIAAVVSAVGGVLLGGIRGGVDGAFALFGLKVIPVVILGGLDSVLGAIVGGLVMGVLENLSGGYLDPLLGGGVKEVAPFIALVAILSGEALRVVRQGQDRAGLGGERHALRRLQGDVRRGHGPLRDGLRPAHAWSSSSPPWWRCPGSPAASGSTSRCASSSPSSPPSGSTSSPASPARSRSATPPSWRWAPTPPRYLAGRWNLPFPVVIPAAGLVTALVGMVFGVPSLRLKGLYLAVATLAAHFVIEFGISHWESVTGGVNGISIPSPKAGPLVLANDRQLYFLALPVTAGLLLFARNLFRTKVGKAFVAIRDQDISSEVMGVNVFRYKLLSFAVSSFYVGVAGSLLAYQARIISPENFPITVAIDQLGMIIIGGLGSILGSVFGAVFITLLPELLRLVTTALSTHLPASSPPSSPR